MAASGAEAASEEARQDETSSQQATSRKSDAPESQTNEPPAATAETDESGRHESNTAESPGTEATAVDSAGLFEADKDALEGGKEEEPPEPESFKRSQSPATMQRNKTAQYGKVGEHGINKMHRFSLYETSTRFYLIGADVMDKQFRVLKIDRTAPPENLTIFEDDIVYDKREMNQLLNAIDDGNKASGGLRLKCSTWGVLGFIRFTEAYYMLLITRRAQVALIGGHFIYQIEGTELVPLTTGSSSRFQRDRNPEETRYLSIFNTLDLNHFFYFSYSYNVTETLQENIIRERRALNAGHRHPPADFNEMFVWNHHLLEPAQGALRNPYDWCLPVVHGFIDQAPIDVFGRKIYLTVIARRSRFFAGARFLKRGTNDLGYVANDVETEQIVSDLLTTSFHAPGPRLYSSPTYTSYVQHRGSIPLYWTQDNSGVSPKPDIDLNLNDPFYSAAALHFDNLFERYGAPVYVLNLIKARERTPRESKLLHAYKAAIDYLNQSLPGDKQILYRAFDMSRASKTRGQDVIGTLEVIAEDVLDNTKFFHNGDIAQESSMVQNGVARTNCIDCLDRTNAAQFVIGKRALGKQLHALGVISPGVVEYDTDAVNIFTRMWHAHGDTIAIQYGGSHLVNTMATYRKINQWQSQSRDMVESFKRYYHNSFLDSQRQEAYNLFLGNYIYSEGQPMLWDLASDYYLHHADPRKWSEHQRRDYIHWFTPKYLEPRRLPPTLRPLDGPLAHDSRVGDYDDYWLEYYRPMVVSSFAKVFSYRKNVYQPHLHPEHKHAHQSGQVDPSPFCARKMPGDLESPGKKAPRKGVTILDPSANETTMSPAVLEPTTTLPGQVSPVKQSILRETYASRSQAPAREPESKEPFQPADKSQMSQWSLDEFYLNSLNPSVSGNESAEYNRYVSHPLNLPLVVSTDPSLEPASDAYADFVDYVRGPGEDGGETGEEDVADFAEFLTIIDDPLTVTDDDGGKKRYRRYRQWLGGKSLFKQSKVDPEHKTEGARASL